VDEEKFAKLTGVVEGELRMLSRQYEKQGYETIENMTSEEEAKRQLEENTSLYTKEGRSTPFDEQHVVKDIKEEEVPFEEAKIHSSQRKLAAKDYSEMTSAELRGKMDANNTVAYLNQQMDKKKAMEKLHENQEIGLELQKRIDRGERLVAKDPRVEKLHPYERMFGVGVIGNAHNIESVKGGKWGGRRMAAKEPQKKGIIQRALDFTFSTVPKTGYKAGRAVREEASFQYQKYKTKRQDRMAAKAMPLKFYNVKAKKSMTLSNYKIETRNGRKLAIATAPDGTKMYRVMPKVE
jgi:hypothetical protein